MTFQRHETLIRSDSHLPLYEIQVIPQTSPVARFELPLVWLVGGGGGGGVFEDSDQGTHGLGGLIVLGNNGNRTAILHDVCFFKGNTYKHTTNTTPPPPPPPPPPQPSQKKLKSANSGCLVSGPSPPAGPRAHSHPASLPVVPPAPDQENLGL